MCSDRYVPRERAAAESGSEVGATVWLAGPAARTRFEPSEQTPEDQSRWREIRTERRREEWEASRALLAHVRTQTREPARQPATGCAFEPKRGATPTSANGAQSSAAPRTPGSVLTASSGSSFPPTGSEHASATQRTPGSVLTAGSGSSFPPTGSEHASATQRTPGSVLTAGSGSSFPPAGSEHASATQRMPAPYSLDGSALSLSHSGGYAAVATSRTAVRLGVDMECARPSDTNRLARFAFSERERAQLEALPADARAERFYILWTLKEAFAKALSLSLFASLARCTFTEERGAWHASVPTANAWVAHVFRPSPSIVLSVVALLPEHVRPDDFSVSTHEWPEPAAHLWRLLATLHSTQHVT